VKAPLPSLCSLLHNVMLSMFAGIQYLVFSPLSCCGHSLKRTGLNSCSEPLISNVMWRNIFGQAAYQIIVFMTFNFAGKKILKLSGTSDEQTLMNNTVIFNAFVFCQVFNEINARRPEKLNVFQGIYKNYVFLLIIGITVGFQVCKNLFLTLWRTCVPFGVSVFFQLLNLRYEYTHFFWILV
jgi:magnesium-transporting ATPase (P-type)